MSNLIEWKTATEIIEILKSQNALVSGMTVAEAAEALGFTATASGAFVKTIITTEATSIAGSTASSVATSAAATAATTTATNLTLVETAGGTAEVAGLGSLALPVAAVAAAGAGGYLIGSEIYKSNPAILDPILLPIFNFVTGSDLTFEDVQKTPTVPIIFNSDGQIFMDSRVVSEVTNAIDSNSTTGDYQNWNGCQNSPLPTSEYPYQCINVDSGGILLLSTAPFYTANNYIRTDQQCVFYKANGTTEWSYGGVINASENLVGQSGVQQTNSTIYGEQSLTNAFLAKTTTDLVVLPEGITEYTPGAAASPIKFSDQSPDWVEIALPNIEPELPPAPVEVPDANPDPEKITPYINPEQPEPTWITSYPSHTASTNSIVPVADPEPDTSTAPFPAPDPLADPSQLAELDPSPEVVPLPDPVNSGGTTAPSIPVTPALSSAANGLLHVYNPTADQINSFGAWLWTTFSGDLIDTLSKLFNNPMDAVIGLHELYSTPITSAESVTIRAGYLDSGVASRLVSSRYSEIKCGAVSVPEYWGNYLDYAPYTKSYCYLPFIGIVELNTDDIVGSGVEITYKIDSYNGSCIALITTAKAGSDESVTYEFSGNCAVELPITSGMKSSIQNALLGATTLALAASTGGASIAAAAMIGGARGASSKNIVQHSGSFGSSYGAMGIKTPYLIIKRPKQKVVYGYNTNYGYPAHKMVLLSTCSGYLKAKEVDVISPTATEDEKKMIEQLLKSGVFID
jgi:hypothetical protein